MRAKRIALLLSTILVFGFIAAGCSGINGNKEVANVNGEKITIQEFEFLLQSARVQMEAEAQAKEEDVEKLWDTEEAVNLAKEKALEAAVMSKVELLKAKELGLSLTEDELKQITESKKAYRDRVGGAESYKKQLAEIGLDDKSFTTLLKNDKLSEKLYEKITSEGTEYNISEQQVKAYYDEQYEKFKIEPTVQTKHILLSTVDENRQPLPQDKQDEVKRKAQDVYARVKAGEDFDTLMNEYSEDPGLQHSPDGYAVTETSNYVQAFKDNAFALEVGEISEIVETEFGYHILKAEDKYDHMPFEQVKDWIEQTLVREKYAETVKEWKKDVTVHKNEEVLKKMKVKTE
ncbi:MAG: peptidylprolyl isomerase [Firmicutes bacterium]|nr:peptidylprolyl isomerase [Bacillota bacterium]